MPALVVGTILNRIQEYSTDEKLGRETNNFLKKPSPD